MNDPIVYNFNRDECSSRGILLFLLILIIIIALFQMLGNLFW